MKISSLLIQMIGMRISVKYHKKVLQKYWGTHNQTHRDMSDENFDFYAAQIAKLLGEPKNRHILDYGAGGGGIASRLQEYGYRMDAAEFSKNFEREIVSRNLTFVTADDLPSQKYDVVIANNCMFYVHPNQLIFEIGRILETLKPKGELWITDVPTVQKIDNLNSSWIKKVVHRILHIYQPEIGGFFVNGRTLRHIYNAVPYDSWSNYRQHFKIIK